MTTIGNITDRIINRLEKGTSVLVNVLDGALDISQTDVTLSYDLAGAGVGSVIEIDAELMYVVAKPSTLVRTVMRGWQSTTAATHDDGVPIKMNPRFSRADVITTIEEELHSWPVELHRWDTVEVSLPSGEWKVGLSPTVSGATIHRLLDANVLAISNATDAQRSRVDPRLIRDADEDEYSSGWAIQLPSSYGEARTIQVDMVTSYDTSALGTLTTDLQSDVGVRSELVDALVYGVLWRNISVLEIGRTNPAAAPSVDSAEVPPTHIMQTGDALLRIRNQRLSEERARLFDHWPLLMTMMGD